MKKEDEEEEEEENDGGDDDDENGKNEEIIFEDIILKSCCRNLLIFMGKYPKTWPNLKSDFLEYLKCFSSISFKLNEYKIGFFLHYIGILEKDENDIVNKIKKRSKIYFLILLYLLFFFILIFLFIFRNIRI